jgi:hypothetical protein
VKTGLAVTSHDTSLVNTASHTVHALDPHRIDEQLEIEHWLTPAGTVSFPSTGARTLRTQVRQDGVVSQHLHWDSHEDPA